jgi:hypothetical protein
MVGRFFMAGGLVSIFVLKCSEVNSGCAWWARESTTSPASTRAAAISGCRCRSGAPSPGSAG